MSHPLNALLHPFAKGLLTPPEAGRGLFLRAEWGEELDAGWRDGLVCEQSFKPAFDALKARGFDVGPAVAARGFATALCLLSKHKAENLAMIARAWAALEPGGVLVCAGRIDTGAASVAARVATAIGPIETLAKYHCKVFWTRRLDETPPMLIDWAQAGRLREVAETGYFSRPGIHGWDQIDRGSGLLAVHLPDDLAGRVGDLGAGWGYLSAQALARCPAIAQIDLYEAESMALDAAKANLDRIESAAARHFHWHDVTAGIGDALFDAIIMNPPFHAGKETDTALGRRFIAVAAQALAPKGRLFLVANRHLPYEQEIKPLFRRHGVLAETGLFKVIEAAR